MSGVDPSKVAAFLVGLLLAAGVSPRTFESTASAECTQSNCDKSDDSKEQSRSENGVDRLERARRLRDRAMKLMDEDKKRALELFDESIELNPDDGLTWSNRGTVLLNLGRHDAALESYKRSLEVRPDHPYTYCSMASVHNAIERHEKAIEAANRAIEADPEFAPAYLNKARALEALGEEERAQKLRRQALEIDPSLADRVE